MFAPPAQPPHALDGIVHLVRLDVFRFMNMESFVVNFGDENEGHTKILSSGRVESEGRQVAQGTIADECVVANRFSGTASRISHVLNAGSDNFVTIVAN